MNKQEELGTVLRNTRKSRGFTMKEVAEEIGVSESLVSRWENGKVDVRKTKISVMAKLCSILGIDIAEFTDISLAQELTIKSINEISVNLDEPTQELLYAILDLSPVQKMAVLQMIKAMTGDRDA